MNIKLYLLGFALTILSSFIFPRSASADLRICNGRSLREDVVVAVAYRDTSSSDRRGSGSWISEGWWEIPDFPVGTCVTPISGDLTNRYYYYYVTNGLTPDDTYDFCVIPSENFTLIEADSQCPNEGDWRGFAEIDTEGESDFSILLTPGMFR